MPNYTNWSKVLLDLFSDNCLTLMMIRFGTEIARKVKAGDLILKPTREHMEANLIQVFQNKVKIIVSHLKESDAAILGASALAWELK